jgi:hypothetical protein
MATASPRLDAHQKPPGQLKALFKKYQHASKEDLENDPAIIDLKDISAAASAVNLQCLGIISSSARSSALKTLSHKTSSINMQGDVTPASQLDAPIYQVLALPGQPDTFT